MLGARRPFVSWASRIRPRVQWADEQNPGCAGRTSTDTPLASWVRPMMSMRFLSYWDVIQPGDNCPVV
jgi:hypothetical protein